MIDYPSQQGEDVGDYPLINYYVILLRMHTHSCIIVGIVEEKGKNTALEGSGWAKISCPKRDGKHTHQRGKRRDYNQQTKKQAIPAIVFFLG